MKPEILLIMGSDSDLPIVKETAKILDELGISCQMRVLSAHRTPNEVHKLISSARDNGVKIIIAYAGLAAHLPGVVASLTTLPVIGVPVESGALKGMDALFSIVQMPPGIPVATMAIGSVGAKNAALMAASILSVNSKEMADKLESYRQKMRENVLAKDKEISGL